MYKVTSKMHYSKNMDGKISIYTISDIFGTVSFIITRVTVFQSTLYFCLNWDIALFESRNDGGYWKFYPKSPVAIHITLQAMDFSFLLLASRLIYTDHSLTSFCIALVIFERLNYKDIWHIIFVPPSTINITICPLKD